MFNWNSWIQFLIWIISVSNNRYVKVVLKYFKIQITIHLLDLNTKTPPKSPRFRFPWQKRNWISKTFYSTVEQIQYTYLGYRIYFKDSLSKKTSKQLFHWNRMKLFWKHEKTKTYDTKRLSSTTARFNGSANAPFSHSLLKWLLQVGQKCTKKYILVTEGKH